MRLFKEELWKIYGGVINEAPRHTFKNTNTNVVITTCLILCPKGNISNRNGWLAKYWVKILFKILGKDNHRTITVKYSKIL